MPTSKSDLCSRDRLGDDRVETQKQEDGSCVLKMVPGQIIADFYGPHAEENAKKVADLVNRLVARQK